MPYDDKGKWTPDPEDEVYTDPDEKKYLDKDGNDSRFGTYYRTGFVPDYPKIIKLKKEGRWAKMRPMQRRWVFEECANCEITTEMIQPILNIFETTPKFADKRRDEPKEKT
jgi:hypothetical protein